MSFFGWADWQRRVDRQEANDRQTERWFLQKLHGPAELSELAFRIAQRLAWTGKRGTVEVQSVWIDSLPQVVGAADRVGFEDRADSSASTLLEPVKCELADLLYVVKIADGPVRERALLLQGKIARRADSLPTGGSTKTERALLERHSWSEPVKVYRAHVASENAHVGTFKLGSAGSHGFRDYCRYLLISKYAGWSTGSKLGPYMTGWPQGSRTSQLQGANHIDLAECAIEMAEMQSGSPGRNVDNTLPEWNALIATLRDGNNDRYMKGYGGQPYVRKSEAIPTDVAQRVPWQDWFERAFHRYVPGMRLPVVGWSEPYAWHGKEGGNGAPPNKQESAFEPGGFPLLPVITVTIKLGRR